MSTIKAFIEDPGLDAKARPRSKRARFLTPFEVALDDATRRAKTGEWDGAKGAAFVGLYAFCHRRVYGMLPVDLEPDITFRTAAKSAAEVVHRAFDDDGCAMAEFIVWCWDREKRKLEWARQKKIDLRRISWRVQFSRSMEADYRLARSQRR